MGDVGHPEYLEKVKRMVGGLNVDVVADESATRHQHLLAQARVGPGTFGGGMRGFHRSSIGCKR